MQKADFTLVTSSELKNLSARFSKKVYLLPNAANVSLFQKSLKENLPMPEEIRSIPAGRKVICYVGNICHRLDYDLLVKVAKVHHDKILLMVGPFANNNYKTAGMDKMPNVIFAGKKKLDQLPAYLKYSDCCVIPFLCNQLTKSIYPLKINEYLSAGKPVITTNFSEDIRSFKSVIHISDNHAEFVDSIDKAIDNDSPDLQQIRVEYAANNNWTDRAWQFIDIVEKFLHAK
jgi:glycosyltransferase involved in cell wall biosynthesis